MKKSLKSLGIEFQKTKSEKVFKEIYYKIKKPLVNHYKLMGNDEDTVENLFNDAMMSIWSTIDRIDVHNHSISTTIYMKVKTRLLREKKAVSRCLGEISTNQFEEFLGDVEYNGCKNTGSNIMSAFAYDIEEDFIKSETEQLIWDKVDRLKWSKVVKDFYLNDLSYNEISLKYGFNKQKVKNTLRKSRIELSKTINYENLHE